MRVATAHEIFSLTLKLNRAEVDYNDLHGRTEYFRDLSLRLGRKARRSSNLAERRLAVIKRLQRKLAQR